MTSYLDYPDPELETADYDGDQLNEWHNSYKPVVTPGYKPASASTSKPEDLSTEAEIINEGVNQIANTLLSSPPKQDSDVVYIKPKPEYTFSTIDHGSPETILVNPNGTIVDTVARPSDFNVQISAMQTKPTVAPSTTSSTQQTVSTHYPVKPVFKPRPVKTTTENYVIVSTVTKENQNTEVSSIDSIMQMLNDSTLSMKEDVTSPGYDVLETKSSPAPYNSPSYSSPYISSSSYYPSTGQYVTPSTGHYVTLKPSSFLSSRKPSTTKKPYEYEKPSTPKPLYDYVHTSSNSITDYSSPSPSQSTSQALEAFNNYPTDPSDFTDSVTTFNYVSSSTTEKPTLTTRKPPSTSYVTGAQLTRRPITPPGTFDPGYDASPDSFSSVTPTVIVLNGFQTQKPTEEPQFVEISQEPFKKPVNQITVNNHIASTNNIYMNKPSQTYERPSSPTVVITPKPTPVTTLYPVKASTRPSSVTSRPSTVSSRPVTAPNRPVTAPSRPVTVPSRPITVPSRPVTAPTRPVSTRPVSTYPTFDFTDYSPTTFKPELQTSPDDLINFPPVRNPMLNTSGSNPALYNTSISLSDNELSDIDLIHELDFTTPTWKDDEQLNDKMSVFVSKIVGSLQGTFQELHDIVILDKKQNVTAVKTTTVKPKKTVATTRRPALTTKRPVKLTPTTRRPTVTTTKRSKPTKRVTTTTQAATSTTELQDEVTTENYANEAIDYSNKNLFGENDISGEKEPKNPVSRNVRRVIVHREYDALTFENDLALLELESPIKFDAHIVIENSACQEMFQTAGHSKKILNSFICAGYANGQKDSCEGDSGGPLVLQRDDGKWQLVGTVSHGIKCAAPFLPGVYMRTTFYKPWLKSITGIH
ncbi:Serine proteinase stubble [Operophtera brumata]|uniref:Serine proteinase stubble n=1 Tax=Operophtera brumata TaxID=104452 RepID=A0A0L7L802_OPEBR|nr:Serine proteinase stubble [Operophtera brumata]